MNEMNTSVTSSIISGMLLDNQNYTNTMTNASNEISETMEIFNYGMFLKP